MNRVIKRIGLLSLIALSLCACETLQAPKEDRSDYAAYAKALSDARTNPAKLVEFECSPPGCNFTKFVAYQAGGASAEIKPPAPTRPPEHALVGMVRELKETVVGLAPFAAPIFLVGAAMKPMKDMAAAFAERPPTTTTNTNITNNASGTGSVVGGGTASNTTTNNTTTTTTTTQTTNSNNTARNCQSGNGGQGTTAGGASGPATC